MDHLRPVRVRNGSACIGDNPKVVRRKVVEVAFAVVLALDGLGSPAWGA
jgi:hypothetical protein